MVRYETALNNFLEKKEKVKNLMTIECQNRLKKSFIYKDSLIDQAFDDIWLSNKYYLLLSQKVANKLLEISLFLSEKLASSFLRNAIIAILDDDKIENYDRIIYLVNFLCDNDCESDILCLMQQMQRDHFINIINSRPEESLFLSAMMSSTYL